VPVAAWERATDVPWAVDKPNNGFMLVDDETVVGVQLAFYSQRTIDGRIERFCNVAALCVLPEYRQHGFRLLRALLAQREHHFTDLSPSGNVPALNARLGFKDIDTSGWIAPNLPWPSLSRSRSIVADRAAIARLLEGRNLELFNDHTDTGAAHHLVLTRGAQHCYVIFRKDRRFRLRLFATILYVSDPVLFRSMARPLARHLLVHHGAIGMIAEERIVRIRPPGALVLQEPQRRMFRSSRLEPAHVDYLYSELVCVAW
jgi:GNAT superfamily N-acetyltransferase